MMKTISILLIEDIYLDVILIKEMLKEISSFNYDLVSAATLKEGREQIQKNNFDIILLDLNLPDSIGHQTFTSVLDCCEDIPIVLVSGVGDEELSLKLIKEDAQDYITKQSLNSVLLGKSILYSIERKQKEIILKEREESLKHAQEIAKMGSWEWDIVLQKFILSDNYFAIHGLKPDKDIPSFKFFRSQIHPDDRHILDEDFATIMKDKKTSVIELRIILPDGTVKWTQNNIVPFIENDKLVKLKGVIIDITEHKRAEEALRESEESYRKLFENHSAVKIILDPDTSAILDANDAAAQYYGWTREELKHMKIYQINTLSPEEVNVEMERAISKRRNRFEFRHRRADGSIRDVEVFSSKIEIRGNDVLHLIIQDITERKQMEEALQNKTALLDAQLNSNIDGILIVDKSGKKILQNQRTVDLWKIPKHIADNEDEKTQVAYIMHMTVNPEKFAEKIKYLYDHPNETSQDEVELTDGTVLERYSAPVIGESEQIYGRIWVFHDITERKLAEEKLIIANKELVSQNEEKEKRAAELIIANEELAFQNVEKAIRAAELIIANKELAFQYDEKEKWAANLEIKVKERTAELAEANKKLISEIEERKRNEENLIKLEKAVSSSGEAIFITDPDGIFIYVNPAFTGIYGYSPEELVGKATPRVLKSGLLKPQDYEIFWKTLLDKQEVRGESTNKRKDGTVIDIEVSASPIIDEKNNIIGFLSIQRDITQRKQVENEIKQNLEREKELNKLKSQFISTVSHEFRTPLTGIQTSVQLLELYGDKWDAEKKQNTFNKIYNSIRFTNLLLDDVSLVGKDESGKLSYCPSLCIIQDICSQALEDIKAVFGNKVVINYSIIPDDLQTFADESLLRHIINNLLSNAVKYSGQEKQIEFSAIAENDDIVFTITDHGIGIPEEDMEHLFESFCRASNVEAIKGTGLGLSIVKRCVEIHEGTIELKSTLNKGTTVVVKIPYKKQGVEV